VCRPRAAQSPGTACTAAPRQQAGAAEAKAQAHVPVTLTEWQGKQLTAVTS